MLEQNMNTLSRRRQGQPALGGYMPRMLVVQGLRLCLFRSPSPKRVECLARSPLRAQNKAKRNEPIWQNKAVWQNKPDATKIR
jgi:hypothetical protein